MSENDVLLTADEVAARLRVTTRTVRRWACDGFIQAVPLGGRLTRYTPESVDAFIAGRRARMRVTDEMARRALRAWQRKSKTRMGDEPYLEMMRAALEAALNS